MDQLNHLSALVRKISATRSSLALFWILVILSCQQMATLTWRLLPTSASGSAVSLERIAPPSSAHSPRQLDARELLKLALFGKPEVKVVKPVAAPTQDSPRTRLNLTLTGLLASSSPDRSIAIILNGGDEQGYGEGDIVNGTQASITSILADRVILDNQGQSETLMLDGEEFKPLGQQAAPQQPEPNTPTLSKLRDNLAKDPGKLLDYINISPVMADGKLKGYRINPGKDVAFFHRIGLLPNDLAVSINGYDLRDNGQAMQIMQQLSSMSEMNLTVERNGQQQDIYIRLTE
ncbi:MAG: type II secretion system protein GspC [Aeromonadaceae bacterium]